ncbi:MAG: DinB family protein [Planctomycetaceae bacterium]|nr:DinB family protein [Planctomycetaceae bacterium]
MHPTILTLNQFLLGYFDSLVKDLPMEKLAERPAGTGHSCLWLLGHIAISVDFGNKVLGQETVCPARWFVAFGPGSSDDVKNPEKYDAADMIDIIRTGYPKLQELALAADESLLAEPHPVEMLQNTALKTKGDLLGHLLTTHLSLHLGQLSYWRRLQGKEPIV